MNKACARVNCLTVLIPMVIFLNCRLSYLKFRPCLLPQGMPQIQKKSEILSHLENFSPALDCTDVIFLFFGVQAVSHAGRATDSELMRSSFLLYPASDLAGKNFWDQNNSEIKLAKFVMLVLWFWHWLPVLRCIWNFSVYVYHKAHLSLVSRIQ